MTIRFNLTVIMFGFLLAPLSATAARADEISDLRHEIEQLRRENTLLRERDTLLRTNQTLKSRIANTEKPYRSAETAPAPAVQSFLNANAADIAVKALPPAPPALFSWTGCHVGAHGGGGWAQNTVSFAVLPDLQVRSSGWLAGGQIGCDYQHNNWVFGVEGSYSWADLKGRGFVPGSFQDIRQLKIDGIATLTGRVGYAFDRILPYAKAGGAWVHTNLQSDFIGFGAFAPAYNSGSGGAFGWLVGAGVEFALLPSLSLNAEYNYINLGTNSINAVCNNGAFCFPLGGVGIGFPQPVGQELQFVKLGLNYRFPVR